MKKYSSQGIKEFFSKPIFDEKGILNKDPSWPRISIVTPSYNQAQFLERTILSVLNQNYPNLEYIIIDGGSTDGSIKIIKKYEKYFAYWINEKDKGQADGINKGFKKATGDIFTWLNSDDIYLPNTLFKIAEVFTKYPNVDVIYGNQIDINEKDEIIGEMINTYWIPFISELGFKYGGFGFHQPASFWRKEIFFGSGLLNPGLHFCMDIDMFIRFILNNAKFKYVREYFACFRHHQNSKTSRLQYLAKKEIQEIYNKYKINTKGITICKNIVRISKPIFYLLQGDILWYLQMIFKKLIKKYKK